ncbi:MAG TPA: glycosyltransferase family 39 protein, partial [Isosphaeraceae bacterium]|nr:glycosyltransferase family 39 protein [Isosphaeraceae bacterium]
MRGASMTRGALGRVAGGVAVGMLVLLLSWADWRFSWFPTAFHEFARLFHEQSPLAVLREPSQMPLARVHLAITGLLVSLGLIASPWLGRHAGWWWAVFVVGYAVRALIWTLGGNMPLVPGDSCHYVEVARSVYRGEGAVKHYVESYFQTYPEIRRGEGILDDWATPLWAYVLAGAYRLCGVVPGEAMTSTFAVAKGTSFALNLLCLPALYGFARRRFDASVGLLAMALLAVLPVHAIYAGFALRESLVALTSLLAIWFLTEVGAATGARVWVWAFAAGLWGGLAVLARNTAMALMAAGGLFGLVAYGRRRWLPLVLWGAVVVAMIGPWAWATYQRYGEPFFTYTKYFEYNFSWTVHHYDQGNTRPGQFYTAENLPGILREKFKSSLVLGFYPIMILSFPVVMGFAHRQVWPPEGA